MPSWCTVMNISSIGRWCWAELLVMFHVSTYTKTELSVRNCYQRGRMIYLCSFQIKFSVYLYAVASCRTLVAMLIVFSCSSHNFINLTCQIVTQTKLFLNIMQLNFEYHSNSCFLAFMFSPDCGCGQFNVWSLCVCESEECCGSDGECGRGTVWES